MAKQINLPWLSMEASGSDAIDGMARFSRLLSVFLSSPRCSGSSGVPSGSPTTRAFSLRTGSQNSKRQIHTAWLGMESGVQGMLNRVKKGITLGRIRNSGRAANNED
ncbi:hypothetical protein AKJ66_03320 [candidate division MSBL1 archaeon SCGC-AAA259E22]|uniref:Uncharacterized protein n=1 Tax=candidate division MSBL1 archaeon SCGC-AAA259E22 TaxID=1698265 RepID=A0A133UF89_9EURY|nr:hypothetical protein AKJ66_03320 [candidate division MSBL1 archaeon SCGC-AAA259E22]